MRTWSLEHILPKWLGGDDSPDNLAISHSDCNKARDREMRALVQEAIALHLRPAPVRSDTNTDKEAA